MEKNRLRPSRRDRNRKSAAASERQGDARRHRHAMAAGYPGAVPRAARTAEGDCELRNRSPGKTLRARVKANWRTTHWLPCSEQNRAPGSTPVLWSAENVPRGRARLMPWRAARFPGAHRQRRKRHLSGIHRPHPERPLRGVRSGSRVAHRPFGDRDRARHRRDRGGRAPRPLGRAHRSGLTCDVMR